MFGDPNERDVPCSEADKADKVNKATVGLMAGGAGLILTGSLAVCWYTRACGVHRPLNQNHNINVNPAASLPQHAGPVVAAPPVAEPVPTYQSLIELADSTLQSPGSSPTQIITHLGPRSLSTDDALLRAPRASIDAAKRR